MNKHQRMGGWTGGNMWTGILAFLLVAVLLIAVGSGCA